MNKYFIIALLSVFMMVPQISHALVVHCNYPPNVNLGNWSTSFPINDTQSHTNAFNACYDSGGSLSGYELEPTDFLPWNWPID